jgi:hypothetical protein
MEGLGGGIFLVLNGESLYGAILLFLSVILLFVGFLLLYRWRTEKTAPIRATGKPVNQWRRISLKTPDQKTVSALNMRLRSIRKTAIDKYTALLHSNERTKRLPRVNPEWVRINVFLPETKDVGKGEVCGLHIPEGLCSGMENETELELVFRPNEGVTGNVFTREEPIAAYRKTGTDPWKWIHLRGGIPDEDKEFQLTKSQMKSIDPHLRWIISFPLTGKQKNDTYVFGVLNVDGLNILPEKKELIDLYHTLEKEVERFAKQMSELDRIMIEIKVTNIPNG